MKPVFLLLLICASALARSPLELDRGLISNECIMPPCAIPANCERFEQTFTIENGKRCPGCPRCIRECELCPPTPCNNPVTTRRSDAVFGGCPACPKCPTSSRCPVFRCANPGCTNPKPSFFFLDDGTRCQGCPKCPRVSRCSRYCPRLSCANKVTGRVITRRGKECQECDACRVESTCSDTNCPPVKCLNPRPGRIIWRSGIKCRTCSTCPSKPGRISICPNIFCPACVTSEPGRTVVRNGVRCRLCGKCAVGHPGGHPGPIG